MHILEDLWWDHVALEPTVRKSDEYRRKQATADRLEEQLVQKLTPELKKDFERFCEEDWAMDAVAECEAFVRGVRFGAHFLLDILSES